MAQALYAAFILPRAIGDAAATTAGTVLHALMLNRLTYGAEGVTHLDALRWATEGSARRLGREDVGRIEPGREADLALFTLDELRFSRSHDPLAASVRRGATRADRLMIVGRWRVIDGHAAEIDTRRLQEEHSRLATELLEIREACCL